MCGIIAYNGKKMAFPILFEGLNLLEYRGYDSAGIAVIGEKIQCIKQKGKVSALKAYKNSDEFRGCVGIGHTRWATHGPPNQINAHPHLSGKKRLAIVHNGIIENYLSIKQALEEMGHSFLSETDSEVLVHLIEEIKTSQNTDLEEAVRIALEKIIGAYAIVVMDIDEPHRLIGACKSSPLVFGLGDGEGFLASDAGPILTHTNKVVYLQDEEYIVLNSEGNYSIKNLKNQHVSPRIVELDMKLEAIEKGGYDHFMLKEIHQQPATILESMRGRISKDEGWVQLGGMVKKMEKFKSANKIVLIACGTSYHAALIGEYLFEDLARIPVEVEYASEFRYRNPVLGPDDLVIAISQSGETADTIAALKLARKRGATTYGIVNVVGSTIARLTDSGSYTHCGPEIGVASTKAFTGQLTVLSLMALALGRNRGTLSHEKYGKLIDELVDIPRKVNLVLQEHQKIKYIAAEIKNAQNALYMGRGYNFPVALEGALKLKEISYIHAEGYPAAELKHGPIALIDMFMPVIVLATNQSAYLKIYGNIQEIKARKGIVISIVSEDDEEISKISDFAIKIPKTEESFAPLISVVPLQLFAYHIAVMRGCDVDQPRNLAKSVTVE